MRPGNALAGGDHGDLRRGPGCHSNSPDVRRQDTDRARRRPDRGGLDCDNTTRPPPILATAPGDWGWPRLRSRATFEQTACTPADPCTEMLRRWREDGLQADALAPGVLATFVPLDRLRAPQAECTSHTGGCALAPDGRRLTAQQAHKTRRTAGGHPPPLRRFQTRFTQWVLGTRRCLQLCVLPAITDAFTGRGRRTNQIPSIISRGVRRSSDEARAGPGSMWRRLGRHGALRKPTMA